MTNILHHIIISARLLATCARCNVKPNTDAASDFLAICSPCNVQNASDGLRIDYGDGRVTRGSSTEVVISQLCIFICVSNYIYNI